MRHATIAVLLLAAIAGTAVAGPFEDEMDAYIRGDYTAALRLLRPLAETAEPLPDDGVADLWGG